MRQTFGRSANALALASALPWAATSASAKIAGSFFGARPLSLISTILFTARTPSS
jgi:hypothetical protein